MRFTSMSAALALETEMKIAYLEYEVRLQAARSKFGASVEYLQSGYD